MNYIKCSPLNIAAGEDFEAIERNVSFASNDSSVCIAVPIFIDDIAENEEHFVVWFDVSSEVHIIPGRNSSLVIITEVIFMLHSSNDIIQIQKNILMKLYTAYTHSD